MPPDPDSQETETVMADAPTRSLPLEAGQQLVARYKGEQHTCEVVEREGELVYVRPGGETFTSPSAAGRAVTGSNVNGYRFWSVVEGIDEAV